MLRRSLSVSLAAVVSAISAIGLTTPSQASTTASGCYDPRAAITVEEQRLGAALPAGGPAVSDTLIKQGHLDGLVKTWRAGLCHLPGLAAVPFAKVIGEATWRAAVNRAQRGDYDDRPLYWARLEMTKAIHQWRTSPRTRQAVFTALDHASRGLDDLRFPPGTKRVMVSGFDPFQLTGTGLRRSNPAGAAALQLDGRVFQTPQGKVAVQAVTLPVLWGAFDDGIVEAAYGPRLRSSHLDGIVTISQGFPGKFTIERWAANWRGGYPDNNDASERAAVPPALGWPQPQRQFIETTLPHQAMIDAAQGPYPVQYNLPFCQWKPGTTPGVGTPDCHTDGEPTPGAVAASGGGGDYLSNESMFRANRLRLGLGLTTLPGGHLHTPVLDQPADPTVISDAKFVADRKAIADETVSMIGAVARP